MNLYARVYHMAAKIATDGSGRVSPLCARRPRALSLKCEMWTLRWEAVTCRRCLALRPEGS